MAHISIFVLYAWILVVICFDLRYASIGELLSICVQMTAGWSHLCRLLTMSCLDLVDYLCVLLKEMLFVGALSSIPRLHFLFENHRKLAFGCVALIQHLLDDGHSIRIYNVLVSFFTIASSLVLAFGCVFAGISANALCCGCPTTLEKSGFLLVQHDFFDAFSDSY